MMALFFVLNRWFKPYQEHLVNALERREITATLSTFYGGLLYEESNHLPAIRSLLTLLIVVANLWFVTLWICMLMIHFRHYRLVEVVQPVFAWISGYKFLKQDF